MFKVNELWLSYDFGCGEDLYRIDKISGNGTVVHECTYWGGRRNDTCHGKKYRGYWTHPGTFIRRDDFLTAIYQRRLDKPGSVDYSDEETKPKGEVNGE